MTTAALEEASARATDLIGELSALLEGEDLAVGVAALAFLATYYVASQATESRKRLAKQWLHACEHGTSLGEASLVSSSGTVH